MKKRQIRVPTPKPGKPHKSKKDYDRKRDKKIPESDPND